jgi:hypothetical protein
VQRQPGAGIGDIAAHELADSPQSIGKGVAMDAESTGGIDLGAAALQENPESSPQRSPLITMFKRIQCFCDEFTQFVRITQFIQQTEDSDIAD